MIHYYYIIVTCNDILIYVVKYLALFKVQLVFSVIQNPWLFLPVEVLQGLTFGLFYSTMTSYASVVALPGTEATMQAMVGASFEGLGKANTLFLLSSGIKLEGAKLLAMISN